MANTELSNTTEVLATLHALFPDLTYTMDPADNVEGAHWHDLKYRDFAFTIEERQAGFGLHGLHDKPGDPQYDTGPDEVIPRDFYLLLLRMSEVLQVARGDDEQV